MKIKRKNIHFVGIGGAGMCGIAEVLATMGHIVSGSDLNETPTIQKLREQGIKVTIGHDGDLVKNIDIVIYSSAVSKSNPELIRARELKTPILARGDMLAELMAFKKGIAIAGTHGKTTTTSILASIFNEANLDPTVVIGGKFLNIDANAKLGRGDFLIAEVDESDKSFLKTLPTVATITNIDPDHINMFNDKSTSYKNFDEMIAAYGTFVKKIPLLGKIVINQDDPTLFRISKEHIRDYIYFSLKDSKASFFASNIKFNQLFSSFDLYFEGEKVGALKIKMLGEHNIMNALAAIATAQTLGVSFKDIKSGLKSFDGIERRLEFIKNDTSQKIVIDYGHHPTEIKYTLETLKRAFPELKLTVIFQPHRFSRTEYLFEDFTKSFDKADKLYITKIYKASEKEIPGISGEKLAEKTPNALFLESPNSILPELKKELESEPGIVLFLGAGDIYKSAYELL